MERTNPVHIVWFKRDLRVADHEPLAQAVAKGSPVAPLFVVEPDWWAAPDMSARHWAFVAECLQSLREELARLGQPLIIRVGDAVDVFEEFRRTSGVAGIWSHEETGGDWTYARDRRVGDWTREAGVPWREFRQSGVIRQLKTRNGWAKSWDAFMAKPATPTPRGLAPLPDVELREIPTADDLRLATDPCPQRQGGGRAAALDRLTTFLEERGLPYRRAMSSPDAGARACSRLSPHLAWGTLSSREVSHAHWRRRRDLQNAAPGDARGWKQSLSSFDGRLHWRCHFMQKLEDAPRIEFENMHRRYDGLRSAEPDAVRLNAWAVGETGLPFVDACMRSLRATGWLNFRMRAMLTAVASYHLWLHWRAPGEHLARLFTDYEPGIHWSQMQMQSGTTGINTVRIYNPVKQGFDQDPDGVFVRRWIPELSSVPDAFIHEPWKWEKASTVLGKAYPEPIVDHISAARAARDKVWAVRKGADFKREADAIQSKHGSRKSGMRNISARPRRRKPVSNSQLSLALGEEDRT